MASRVANEVRNPLGIMSVHADLARRELSGNGSATEAAHHLGIVTGEIRRVAALVESYLRFGRLPALKPAAVDLDALLDARLAALASGLAAREIAVRRERAAELPPVLADAELLSQVVVNLVQNAMEAMPMGGTLTAATSRTDGVVTLEIADTGPGVAPQDAERIFRPFHTTKPLGAGLGPAVAREIVQEHGGTLTCQSQPSGGSFLLTLPLPEPLPVPKSAPTPETVPPPTIVQAQARR